MANREMTRFQIEIDAEMDTRYRICLVRDDIVAETTVGSTGRLPALRKSADYLDTIRTAAELAGRETMDLDTALEVTSLGKLAAFRGGDARSSILDAAYNWVMRNSVPNYDQGSLEIEDNDIVVFGEGEAVSPSAGQGGREAGTGEKGARSRTRPRASRKLKHSWF